MTGFATNVPPYGSAPVYGTARDYSAPKRNSWGAIIAGGFIAVAVQLLLAVFGAAIGLSVLGASPEGETAKGVGIGAIIWWVISGIIALFCGGFVAGRLSGFFSRTEGLLHGAVTWALATLAALLLLTTLAGTLIGGAWSVVSTTAQTGAQAGVTPPAGATPTPADVGNAAERAPEMAQKAAGPSAGVAWGIFAMLVLGLAAAMAGGAVGVRPERDFGRAAGDTTVRPGMAA